jgi:DNA-binding transcriptional regulator LsrR (DeoR family)
MARTLTPERQKLKQDALSLRYDYGWAEQKIAGKLHVPQQTISLWVTNNLRRSSTNNITHLENSRHGPAEPRLQS